MNITHELAKSITGEMDDDLVSSKDGNKKKNKGIYAVIGNGNVEGNREDADRLALVLEELLEEGKIKVRLPFCLFPRHPYSGLVYGELKLMM